MVFVFDKNGDSVKMAETTKTTRPWALLSPDGFYHKLQGPTFFVGRDENVHLMLKVNISNLM